MNATTSNTQVLSYKELQAKLKSLRDAGHTVNCKLNAKHDVLLCEYNRIRDELETRAQAALDDITLEECSAYPFTSNTVQVENNATYRTAKLPAMNASTAPSTCLTLPALNLERVPSWLTKQHKLYIIDGVDYLMHELEQLLDGSTCELTCEYRPTPQAVELSIFPVSSAPAPTSQTRWDRYLSAQVKQHQEVLHLWLRTQDPTVQQAARNSVRLARTGVEILRCAKAFATGFIAGLKTNH